MTAANELLARLPRTSLIVGKGGVGKTTCAVAVAAHFARRGERALVVSTDPAAALGNVIGSIVTADAMPVSAQPLLDARQLSADALRQAFLDEWRDTIAEILDRGTYLDRDDVNGLVDAALPGADEIFALLTLADLMDGASGYVRIVVDTAPTGHTLRLLALPETFDALLSMLDMMQDKHRFMVRALTHRYRRDRADEFITEMRRRVAALRSALRDASQVAAIVVARNEEMVEAETGRYIASLGQLGVHVAAVIVNAVPGETAQASSHRVASNSAPLEYSLPRIDPPPRGLEAVAELIEQLQPIDDASAPTQRLDGELAETRQQSGDQIPVASLVTALTIVGGKGGVGKSTVACALAVAAVDADARPTLLVSTDPAPSIADALGEAHEAWARTDSEHAVHDVAGLVVRQMDAGAAFARVRDEYQSRIDAVFDNIVGAGLDVAHDRAIVRDLLALAPPGIDELYALSVLGDALAEGRFARIVVDPAPTGHLLRLFEMPALALDWTHRLMRLLLKYRDVVGLGDTAQELLDFAKRTRALDTLLHDATRCSVLLVSLDEPVVRAETERLLTAVAARGIHVSAIVWNRSQHAPAPLTPATTTQQFVAEEVRAAPIGVAALRRWTHSWRTLPFTS
ncbi:MAG TPA: ArsA family ATPase [Gemmatimonadaceae bacterium]